MRIVSLSPAATEWLCAFGAAHVLVGRSHVCDYPSEVIALPAATEPHDPPTALRISVGEVCGLGPDLVVVPGPAEAALENLAELRAASDDFRIVSFEAQTLKQVLNKALELARLAGCLGTAMQFIGNAEKRLAELRLRLEFRKDALPANAPAVCFLQNLEPPVLAGYWMPDVVWMAGGRYEGPEAGHAPQRQVPRPDVDFAAVALPGHSVRSTAEALAVFKQGLPKMGTTGVFDGAAYFHRPGPRLYRSIELMAALLQGGRIPAPAAPVEAWELQIAQKA